MPSLIFWNVLNVSFVNLKSSAGFVGENEPHFLMEQIA